MTHVTRGWHFFAAIGRAWLDDLADVWHGTLRLPTLAECEADLERCDDCGEALVRCRCGGGEG